ncbi:NucA/NucB deoxyribonuclease domain-containing protein [Streptomyces sp. HUAS TT7]|uniref:NucA/NucB deoxyribonuclease domain-containing protein n=1 Tax=Streptomyces sp. HUAS TT7 TaxID=3447507 RepID=UPI003F65C32C
MPLRRLHRQHEHVRRLLAAIASLALTAALLALGTSSAAAARTTARPAPQGHGTCTAVPSGNGAPKGAAWACYEAKPGASAPAPATARALAPAPRDDQPDPESPEALCGKQPPDNSTRLVYCIEKELRWIYYGPDQKEVIGIAEGRLYIYSKLKAVPHSNWKESVIVALDSKSDNIPAVELDLQAICTGQCSASAPLVATLSKKDEHVAGTIDYNSPVGPGAEALVQPQYHAEMRLLVPGTPLPSKNTDWVGPQIRCDGKTGDWTGCVIPEHMANVTIRRSLYRAAAITYEWAQNNLTTLSMGTKNKPLHYKKMTEEEKNRSRDLTCNRAPDRFVKDPSVPDDSCDEFPFAATQEGGKAGTQCVDILPQQVGGVWDVSNVKVLRNGNVKTNAPCVRGHVTNKDNVDAGSKEFGAAVRSDRILDGEAFQVIIAP